jgi:hypothetical protein
MNLNTYQYGHRLPDPNYTYHRLSDGVMIESPQFTDLVTLTPIEYSERYDVLDPTRIESYTQDEFESSVNVTLAKPKAKL